MLNERSLTKAEEKRKEKIVKDLKPNKREFVKRYGKDAESVMYGTAVKRAKKQVKKMNEDRIKEAVRKALVKDEANEELVGGQKKLDADGDGKISAEDFKLLRAKKNMKEVDTGTVTVEDPTQAAALAKQGVNVNLTKEDLELSEDLDLGHEDDEPHMLKGDLYHIGKYAMDLYQMIDQFDDMEEVDFPHWWQSKIIKAKEMMSSAKHYLDFELKKPEIDAMVSVASAEEVIDEPLNEYDVFMPSQEKVDQFFQDNITLGGHYLKNKPVMGQESTFNKITIEPWDEYDYSNWKSLIRKYPLSKNEIEEGLPKGYFAKNTPGGKMEESNVNESFLTATSQHVIKDENLDSFISKMEDAGYKLAKILGPEDNLYKDHPIIDHTWKYGLPEFKDLIGPMRDGDRFRYEDQETYNRMSLEESYDALVKKIKGQGKSEKVAKAIAGAVASYKAKGGGKGPTAKQKK